MDLKLALERDGKMLKKTGFKKCGHRICMIKDPTECGICGKRYTKGTNKYYTSEFMDQIDEIVRNAKENKMRIWGNDQTERHDEKEETTRRKDMTKKIEMFLRSIFLALLLY